MAKLPKQILVEKDNVKKTLANLKEAMVKHMVGILKRSLVMVWH